MRIRRASEVQLLGLRELGLIMVGGANDAQHQRTGGDDAAGVLHAVDRVAFGHDLDGTGVPKQVFNRGYPRQQIGLRPEALELSGLLEQREQSVGNQVDRRFVASHQEQ
jgi:hypothetical protein